MQGVPDRGDEALRIDSGVFRRSVILGRQQRVDEVGRHVLQRDRRLIGGCEAADHLAVGREDHARARALHLAQFVDAGRREGEHADVDRQRGAAGGRRQRSPQKRALEARTTACGRRFGDRAGIGLGWRLNGKWLHRRGEWSHAAFGKTLACAGSKFSAPAFAVSTCLSANGVRRR